MASRDFQKSRFLLAPPKLVQWPLRSDQEERFNRREMNGQSSSCDWSGKAGAKPVTVDRLITNHLSHSRKPREPISKIRKKRIILDTFDTSIENNCRERVTKLLLLVDHVGREKQNTSYFIRISQRDEKKNYTRYACNRATTRGKKGRDLSIFFKDTVARSSPSPYSGGANQF